MKRTGGRKLKVLSVKVLGVEWVSRVITHINKRNVLFFLLSIGAILFAWSDPGLNPTLPPPPFPFICSNSSFA